MDDIIRESDERALILFDAMPMGCNLWDKNTNIVESNREMQNLFGVADQDEYIRLFPTLMPEFQPDGTPSLQKGLEQVQKTFTEGYVRFEYLYLTKSGEPLPLDTILVRVKYRGEDAVAAYVRDLREEKKMRAEFEKAVEEKNAFSNLIDILNGLDAMIYVTDPETYTILFVNDTLKQHIDINQNFEGEICYKLLYKRNQRCDFCPCPKLEKKPDSVIVWEENNSFTNRIYRNTDRFFNLSGGKKVHIQHSVDITDIKEIEEQLIHAKEVAERNNNYKSAFLANMSHEIRTPMNAILGITEIQLQTEYLAADIEESFKKIYDSGNLLLNIINDILDLSKIEAGKLEILPIKYDIPSLINDTVQLNRLRYDSKPIEFLLDVDENTPLNLFGDELRVKQILNNILSNAFKYTNKGEVKLEVFSESLAETEQNSDNNVTIVFRISDTGQGMTSEQLKTLFDEYTRFNLKANRTTIGTGLGMSITKHLVTLMNGEIFAESELDKGSVITVRIPQKRMDDLVCGTELVEKLRGSRFRSRSIMEKTRFLREYMPYGSVLVVDDVESNLYVTRGMLLPYGLKIEMVTSGFEAIEKIKSGHIYDIIFMDHMMPKMDGIEATNIIRGMGYKGSVVALTANALIGQEEIFLRSGFDGFVSKPIDSRELNVVLNEFIRNKKPKEVVEAARREKREKDLKEPSHSLSPEEILKKERFFILDAERMGGTLEGICKKQDTLSDADIAEYTIAVHGMKSVLANIGETELSAFAQKLELAAKEKNLSVMSEETPTFINALKSLVEKHKQKHQEIKTEDGDTDYLRKKLSEIKTACDELNKKAAKAAVNDLLKKQWSEQINSVLDKISLYLLHSEFSNAAEAAEKIASEL